MDIGCTTGCLGGAFGLPDAFGGHAEGEDVAVVVVVELIDAYGAAEAASVDVGCAVVVDEEPASVFLDYRLVVGVAVAGEFIDDAFAVVGAVDVVGSGVGEFLGELDGEGEVVLAVVDVNPGGLGVV